MTLPITRADLQARIAQGQSFEYLPFWGHRESADGRVTASCLSQWFPARFQIDGVAYPTAEHFMMAEKARLFDDPAMLARILVAATPKDAKALGREVRGYDDARWVAHRFDAVVRGNVAKFSQSPALGAYLAGTGTRVLVEASPRDTVWGIGLGASNPRVADPAAWRGLNLLGFALMVVRERLAA